MFCKSLISVCVTCSKCIISSPTWLVSFWPWLKIRCFFLFNGATPGDIHVTLTRFERQQLNMFQFNLMFLWAFQAGYDKQMQTHTPANAITHKRIHIYNSLINCCPQAVVACRDWGGSLVNTQWFTAVQCAFTYNGSLHHRDQPEKTLVTYHIITRACRAHIITIHVTMRAHVSVVSSLCKSESFNRLKRRQTRWN